MQAQSAAATVAAACASVRQWLVASVAAAWWRLARRSIRIDIPVCLGLTLVKQTQFHLSQITGVPGRQKNKSSNYWNYFYTFQGSRNENVIIRNHFKTLSLDEPRSPDFDLFSNQEEYSEGEVKETMAETME
ncbi:hypothetical protein Tco_0742238 [Tanacetum coccineum]